MDNFNRVVIMYDFDKTLSRKYMSEYKLIKTLGFEDNKDFWYFCDMVLAKKYNMDSNLAFLLGTLTKAKENKLKLTKKLLNDAGENITYFNGVESWFEKINEFGKKYNLKIEHYIISSGLKEIIEGSKISKYFTRIFASSYIYDEKGEAFWPQLVVNYTAKTQYIFRIKKNLLDDHTDNIKVNLKQDKSMVLPYSHMIYIGDGETDVPCMKLVKDKGGHSICLTDDSEKSKNTASQLLKDKRVNIVAVADYSENSQLDKFVKKTIKNIANKVNK